MDKIVCNACGKTHENLIKVNQQHFCELCVKEMLRIINASKAVNYNQNQLKPREMVDLLNEYVISQDEAKKIISTAIYNQVKSIKNTSDVKIDKSNILLVGPTGSGKTHIIQSLSKELGIPLSINDATTLTSSGYVGDDVSNVLRRLVEAADGDIELAQKGIVFIDEIDKIGRKGKNPSITRDVSGEGVQQELLRLVEGCDIDISLSSNRRNPSAPLTKFNTDNVLFIIGGSFENIEKIIRDRLIKENNVSFGFNSSTEDIIDHQDVLSKKLNYNNYIDSLTVDDLKTFGMTPEFLGRFSLIAKLKELTEEELLRILKEPKNALSKQYVELFKFENIDVQFTDEFLKDIASVAIKRGTGARSLKSIMDDILLEYMYNIDDASISSIVFKSLEDIEVVRKESITA